MSVLFQKNYEPGKVVLNVHITKVLTADISTILFHNNMKDNKLLTILQSEWYDFFCHGLYYSASGSTGEYLPKVDCLRGVFFWFSLKFNFNRLNIRSHIYIERYIMGLVEMTTFTMKLLNYFLTVACSILEMTNLRQKNIQPTTRNKHKCNKKEHWSWNSEKINYVMFICKLNKSRLSFFVMKNYITSYCLKRRLDQ